MIFVLFAWIIIIVFFVLGLLGFKQAIKNKSFVRMVVGWFCFFIFMLFSLFTFVLADMSSGARDRSQLIMCRYNLRAIYLVIAQYRKDYDVFPSSLSVLDADEIRPECSSVHGGTVAPPPLSCSVFSCRRWPG